LLHSFAYNLVNLFRLQLPSSMRSAKIETLRVQLFKIGARIRETSRCVRIHLASGWPFTLIRHMDHWRAIPQNNIGSPVLGPLSASGQTVKRQLQRRANDNH
jgi:hypothetical protein